jgi:3-oxoacyl-[acyl-carrier protein] reductase
MKLQSKVAIITGAGRGIGRSIAIEFVREGAKLGIVSRTKSELTTTAEYLRKIGGEVLEFNADISNSDNVRNFVDKTQQQFGRIDVLVNNAGILGPAGPMDGIDVDKWVQAIKINLIGTFLCCRYALQLMVRRKSGKIVNLSGAGAPLPYPMYSAYSTSKIGVLGLTQTLAEETKEHNIQVNAIAPGAVDTRLQDEILAAGSLAGAKALTKANEVKKKGGASPEEVARLAVFLASESSDRLTGRLISAVWDDWRALEKGGSLQRVIERELFTLRRIDDVLFTSCKKPD